MQESENIPKTIGRYEIKRLLGSGAMGSVYLAEDPRIKRKLAIKVVKLDAIRSEGDRKEFLARFQREAEVSGVLNDPGIVTIYDVGDSDLGPFLAMEFVQGRPLDAIVKSGELPNMPLRAKLQIACGVAAGLDHAHAHGIIHRDVKPGNVMITEEGRPKLMDFGIAKREDASLTQTGTFLGTPSYASPEQIKEGHATTLSDVFSFGVMIFELLSGTLPFPGSSINTILYKIVNEPPIEVRPPVAGLLPESWQKVFNRVLAKNPKERYPSCSAFIRELMEAATELDKDSRMELMGLLRQGGGTLILPTTVSRLQDEAQATGKSKAHGSKGLLLGGIAAGVVILALGGFMLFKAGGEQVKIATDPPGAVVLKDGKEVGKTALVLPMKAGEKVLVSKDGFKSVEYAHKPGDVSPRFQLESEIKDVTLRTDPDGAEVVMDSRKLEGTTPLKVRWDWGKKHSLNFTHAAKGLSAPADFNEGEPLENIERIVVLMASNEPRTTGEVKTIDPNAPGTIKFAGEFAVKVKLDGKDLGDKSSIASVPPGSHKLELVAPHVFYKESRTLNVAPGKTTTVELPGLSRLTVSTFPTSGTVVIDGQPTVVESDGNTPIQVVRGRHTISIQGKPNSSRSVEVDKANQELPPFKI